MKKRYIEIKFHELVEKPEMANYIGYDLEGNQFLMLDIKEQICFAGKQTSVLFVNADSPDSECGTIWAIVTEILG
jgi:hypothetical protein